MKEIKAVIQAFKVDAVLHALHTIENLPVTVVSEARSIDTSHGGSLEPRLSVIIELMVPDTQVAEVVDAIEKASHTGNVGDGRIFVIPIDECVLIRTGERGETAR